MIYADHHIVLENGRYIVYEREDPQYGYVGRRGNFGNSAEAKAWIRELRRAKARMTEVSPAGPGDVIYYPPPNSDIGRVSASGES